MMQPTEEITNQAMGLLSGETDLDSLAMGAMAKMLLAETVKLFRVTIEEYNIENVGLNNKIATLNNKVSALEMTLAQYRS